MQTEWQEEHRATPSETGRRLSRSSGLSSKCIINLGSITDELLETLYLTELCLETCFIFGILSFFECKRWFCLHGAPQNPRGSTSTDTHLQPWHYQDLNDLPCPEFFLGWLSKTHSKVTGGFYLHTSSVSKSDLNQGSWEVLARNTRADVLWQVLPWLFYAFMTHWKVHWISFSSLALLVLHTEHNIYYFSAVPVSPSVAQGQGDTSSLSEGTQTDGWIPWEEQTYEQLADIPNWALRHHHILEKQLPLESYNQQGTEFLSSRLEKYDGKRAAEQRGFKQEVDL